MEEAVWILDRWVLPRCEGQERASYLRLGQGSSRVVLIHGLGADCTDWTTSEQLRALERYDATYLAVDLRGHGYAGRVAGTRTVDEVAADVSHVADHLGWLQFGVVGYSFGGLVGLHLASRDPRVTWSVSGGVGRSAFSRERTTPLMRALEGDDVSGDEAVTATVAFIRSRRRVLNDMARLLRAEATDPTDLDLSRGWHCVIGAESDEARGISELVAELAGDVHLLRVAGDHVRAFTSGTFLQEALDEAARRGALDRLPKVQETASSLLVIAGRPGAGKTALAVELGRSHDVAHVSTDRMRRSRSDVPTYDAAETSNTYAACVEEAVELLPHRELTIFDGTGLGPRAGEGDDLSRLMHYARHHGHRAFAIQLDADPSVLRERVARRPSQEAHPWDFSQADSGVLEAFLTFPDRPEYVRLDTGIFTTAEASHLVSAVVDGVVPPVLAEQHMLMHEALHRSARSAPGPAINGLKALVWFPEIERQVEQDRVAGVFRRWGQPTVVDQNVGSAVVARAVLDHLSGLAGHQSTWPVANAGLAHTYGYLFAPVWTPYGWKRDRWVNAALPTILGLDRRLTSTVPPFGTLLSNLTVLIDALVSGAPGVFGSEWVGLRRGVLVETDPVTGSTMESWLFTPTSQVESASSVLVYSERDETGFRRFVTAFPVTPSNRTAVFEDLGTDRPLRLRYNAVGVQHLGDEPAIRVHHVL